MTYTKSVSILSKVGLVAILGMGTNTAFADTSSSTKDIQAAVATELLYKSNQAPGYKWSAASDSKLHRQQDWGAVPVDMVTASRRVPGAANSEDSLRSIAEASDRASAAGTIYRWGIRSNADQSIYRWGIRSDADQSIYRWGIRSNAGQSIYRWGIRSNADQSIYRWGIR
jgi:hypothetical protein